jgi:polar amino acid transport system substrate-binding protein
VSETESTESEGMSQTTKILIGALVAIAVIAMCAIVAATAVVLLNRTDEVEPTAIAPATAPATDDSWARIQAAGKIVVGTSADYPPFEFYTAQGQVDGFDIALMDEIGGRLGVQVEYRDFAFDALINTLQLNEIDAAIAAISVTPERDSAIDFSNVYLVGADGILAHRDAAWSVSSVDDLAQLRVGVQRGSVYEDWLSSQLVATGKMPEGNLLAYEKAEDIVRDLREGRIDLAVMDLQPAKVAAVAGGVKLVALGLNQQQYAIALPQGAQPLKAEIDRVLTELHNEGVIAQLAQQYLDIDQLLPTPTPAATSTPGPAPDCVDGLTFVEHLTQEGDMAPGQAFAKGWRVTNSGTCTWDANYLVVHVSGDAMGGAPVPVTQQVAPGGTYDIQVNLIAPPQPGTYQAQWQMQNGQGNLFGEQLQVSINVLAGPTAPPPPTQTPVARIIFTVDRDQIKAGDCVNFFCRVDNVQEVYFYAEGEDWQGSGVAGEGTQAECPPATWAYYLRVVKLDGTVENPSITVYVEPVAGAPVIERFAVLPPAQIALGECVGIQWNVAGDVDSVAITANDRVLLDSAPASGSTQDCPAAAGTVAYGIAAVGPGGTSNGSQMIQVVEEEEPATPAPTTPPEEPTATAETPEVSPPIEVDPPVIDDFAVTPAEIEAGGSVGIAWAVSGGTDYTRILRDGVVIMDNAGLVGQAMDILDEPGTYVYQLEATNPGDESVTAEQTVTVTEAE